MAGAIAILTGAGAQTGGRGRHRITHPPPPPMTNGEGVAIVTNGSVAMTDVHKTTAMMIGTITMIMIVTMILSPKLATIPTEYANLMPTRNASTSGVITICAQMITLTTVPPGCPLSAE